MFCVRPRTSIRYGQQNEWKNCGQSLENPISDILFLIGRRCSGDDPFVHSSHQVTKMKLNEKEGINGASVHRTRYAFSCAATHAQHNNKQQQQSSMRPILFQTR